jgi:hypothetical protein
MTMKNHIFLYGALEIERMYEKSWIPFYDAARRALTQSCGRMCPLVIVLAGIARNGQSSQLAHCRSLTT